MLSRLIKREIFIPYSLENWSKKRLFKLPRSRLSELCYHRELPLYGSKAFMIRHLLQWKKDGYPHYKHKI